MPVFHRPDILDPKQERHVGYTQHAQALQGKFPQLFGVIENAVEELLQGELDVIR